MRRLGKYTGILASLLVMLALTTPAAFAGSGSPHFIGTPTCTKSLTSGLTCSGKAAGLDSEASAFLTADKVTATYVCKNHGGNIAPGQPVVTNDVIGPVQTIAPHNGNITFSPTIPVPAPPSAATECPNGNWSVVLTSLTFTNVVLHIQQSGVDVLTYDFGTIDP